MHVEMAVLIIILAVASLDCELSTHLEHCFNLPKLTFVCTTFLHNLCTQFSCLNKKVFCIKHTCRLINNELHAC